MSKHASCPNAKWHEGGQRLVVYVRGAFEALKISCTCGVEGPWSCDEHSAWIQWDRVMGDRVMGARATHEALRKAFEAGAVWWEHEHHGCIMLRSERKLAWAKASSRWPEEVSGD